MNAEDIDETFSTTIAVSKTINLNLMATNSICGYYTTGIDNIEAGAHTPARLLYVKDKSRQFEYHLNE